MEVEELNNFNQKIDEIAKGLAKYESTFKNQAISNLMTAQQRINQIYQESRAVPTSEEKS